MQKDTLDIKQKIELYVLGELDKQEHKSVLDAINDNLELKNYYNQLRTLVKSEEYIRLDNKFNIEGSRERLNKRILLSQETKSTNFKFLFRVAASLLIITVLGSLYFYFIQQNQEIPNEYCVVEAPLGAKTKVQLPDNTKVMLNAGSKIKYAANFNQLNAREVELSGEAFFDVAKNKKHPFIVKAGDVFIKALGTEFNVKAYEEENIIAAALVEGSIEVSKAGQDESVLLKPNQIVAVFKEPDKANKEKLDVVVPDKGKPLVKINKIKNTDVFLKKDINTDLVTSWKDDVWIIQNMSMREFSVLLERRYNVNIELVSTEINQFQFSGSFSDQTLELILKALQLTAPIKYTIEPKKVTIDLDKSVHKDYLRFLKQK